MAGVNRQYKPELTEDFTMGKEPYRQMLLRLHNRNTKMVQEYLDGKKQAHEIYRAHDITRQRFFQILDKYGVTKRHEPFRARKKK